MTASREVALERGTTAQRVLEARQVTKTYRLHQSRRSAGGKSGTLCAVQGVDIALYEGRTLALVGESGCGKSTFARILAQLARPTSGQILLRGHLDHRRQSMSVFAGQSSRQDSVDSPVSRRDMLSIIAQ